MDAVAKVFMYKQARPPARPPSRPRPPRPRPQTAVEFEAGRLGPDGKPQPFRWTMLYDVIRQLQPTPEIVFVAWSQGLDYNIGTAAHSFAAMTAACESFGIEIGHFLKKPWGDDLATMCSTAEERSAEYAQKHPVPERQEGQDEEEFNLAMEQWKWQRDRMTADSTYSEMPSVLAGGGSSRKERRELLVAMERRRRAVSLYRHRCMLNDNPELPMKDPVALIDHVMSGAGLPPDSLLDTAVLPPTYMPLWSSCIFADAVQVGALHNPQAVVQWCSGSSATSCEVSRECSKLGVKQMPSKFRKRNNDGPTKWDPAWMSKSEPGGWMAYACEVLDNNVTCKIFDLHKSGLRDLFYMLSTQDNQRRCTEDPRGVPHYMSTEQAFMDDKGDPIGDVVPINVWMRGVRDARLGTEPERGQPVVEAIPRHPYARVPNVPLQRCLDTAMRGGRYPTMMTHVSNNVVTASPLRLRVSEPHKFVEVNTAEALKHANMVAEAVVRCSLHCGMENCQEKFYNDVAGPRGLCAADVCDAPDAPLASDVCTKLPYSFDIVSIALTLDAMSRFYDDVGAEYCAGVLQDHADIGFDLDYASMPDICTRFAGFPEENRLLISLKLPQKRPDAFAYVEAGDNITEGRIKCATASIVSLSIGHQATDEEVVHYLKQHEGSRSMSDVRGDLLSMSTWRKHALTSLTRRGMIDDDDDEVAEVLKDSPYCLRQRVAELASIEINRVVDRDPRMADADLHHPEDAHLTPEKRAAAVEERRHRVRTELYESVELEPCLDALRAYGPLRITSRPGKLTYERLRAQEIAAAAEPSPKRKDPPLTTASQFEDSGRLNKMRPPGARAKRRQHPAPASAASSASDGQRVTNRGLTDTRNRPTVTRPQFQSR
jgi:hypothetical protein